MNKTIYLAGGCFWGIQAYIKRLKGVINTSVGYANGITNNPTYKEVCNTDIKFIEAIKVVYENDSLKLEDLLKKFLKVVDPTSIDKQGNDKGYQYRSGIYFEDKSDEIIILNILNEEQEKYKNPIVMECKKIEKYFLAEEYHQDYLDKNPNGYCHINLAILNE